MLKAFFCSLSLIVLAALAPAGAHADNSSTMNFRFDPVFLLVGFIDAKLDFAVNDQWTLGPELMYWHLSLSTDDPAFTSDFDITAYALGARANWFANGIYTDGLYVGPSLRYAHAEVKTTDQFGSIKGEGSGLVAACLVGYGWFWDSFNMMLGGGINLPLGDTKVTVTDSAGAKEDVKTTSTGSLALEFSLGWTF